MGLSSIADRAAIVAITDASALAGKKRWAPAIGPFEMFDPRRIVLSSIA
jgi:hypothetical protein